MSLETRCLLRSVIVWMLPLLVAVGCRPEERVSVPDAKKRQEPAPHLADPVAIADDVEPADNSYCYVCHYNYTEDKLTLNHEAAGIGCESCHGKSDRHSADEDGLIPPDAMFPRDRINAYCMTCHGAEAIAAVAAHEDVFDTDQKDRPVCTDCHGKHRLTVRTRIWDKQTGALLSDDGVRMMYEDSPANLRPKDTYD